MTSKNEPVMPDADAQRVFELRCQSKAGRQHDDATIRYLGAMHRRYPKQYAAMTDRVFEETKPFGSAR